jgi:energy-coupling factor transporter ATP-binding protein EcfA2
LDKFVDLTKAIEEEDAAREQLLTLQTQIEQAEQKVLLIPQYERSLVITKQQLAALQKPEVKELIDLQRHLAREREVRTQIADELRTAKDNLGTEAGKKSIENIVNLAEPAELTVGGREFQAIVAGAAALQKETAAAQSKIDAGLNLFEKVVSQQLTGWKAKDSEAQKRIDATRRELEALRITFDMSYIAKLAKDEASHAQSVKNLKSWQPHLRELRLKRSLVLTERWQARERIATLRDAFARRASATLKEALSDLQVSLKYSRSAHSPDATNLIIETMGWRTNQQVRANWLVEQLTIPVLLNAIQRSDTSSILSIKTPENVAVFDKNEAETILERLGQPAVKFALERAALHDLPRLNVSKEVADGQGGKRFVVRDFSKLSLGQQQSVLLALMLASDGDRPLIIDQPEDNLDGEFIYATLVPVLRRAKERRQIIIVTHNPNVAVLGDAELIIVMKAIHDRGEIVSRGSIDHHPTREAACAILEGAKEAFLRRARMYGLDVRTP